jgi:MoxR-like ATPase
VSTDDIAAVARPVLRHRLVTNFNADAEGLDTDAIIARILELIPADESEVATNPRTAKAID